VVRYFLGVADEWYGKKEFRIAPMITEASEQPGLFLGRNEKEHVLSRIIANQCAL
jgi:hypothetical protein